MVTRVNTCHLTLSYYNAVESASLPRTSHSNSSGPSSWKVSSKCEVDLTTINATLKYSVILKYKFSVPDLFLFNVFTFLLLWFKIILHLTSPFVVPLLTSVMFYMYAQFPCLDTRGGSSSSRSSFANLKLIFPSNWFKNVFIFGELSWSDKHYCKTKAMPTYCYNDICPNHCPLFPRTHFSTKPPHLLCLVVSNQGEDMLNSPPPSAVIAQLCFIAASANVTAQSADWPFMSSTQTALCVRLPPIKHFICTPAGQFHLLLPPGVL